MLPRNYDAIKVTCRTESGAPRFREVHEVLSQVDADFMAAWTTAELLRSIECTPRPVWVEGILKEMDALRPEDISFAGKSPSMGYSLNDLRRRPIESQIDEPDLRLHRAKYHNPLELLITVVTVSAISIIVTTVWAIRYYARIAGEHAVRQNLGVLSDHVAKVVSSGDNKAIKEVRPIAMGLIKYATDFSDHRGKIRVKFGPLGELQAESGTSSSK